ncbi:glycosyltransferase [Aromatoleum aromaticum]|uniref:Glycosyltransferase n=1 Tax=Aromatoleum aromaticum (strain DSM 19018 / LMG 30748 / EbN1) TaxID=76114 RepID=Q5P2B1_AROAE|nr:glycosyltransferase [Aromatoleum aromaticum]NMG56085.1 glycosyltransferase [Aromatoleum aromaticum]CAI08553.1 conserved hypothetical protein, possibly glycosyltransferase [Aromatoleum aromaticum EbN1]
MQHGNTPKRLDTLFLCPTQPIAEGAGIQKRAWAHIEALSKAGEVDIVLLLTPGQISRLEPLDALRARCRSLHLIPLEMTARARTSGVPGATFLRRLLTWGRPMTTLRNCPELGALRARISKRSFDLVYCFRLRNYTLLEPLLGCSIRDRFKVFVDFDDIESIALQREISVRGASTGFEQRLLMKLEQFETADRERQALNAAVGVSVCSALDAERLHNVGSAATICVVPNSLPDVTALPLRPASGEVNLLFLGTMTYQPNEDAALFLIGKILPLIKVQAKGTLALEIVGRGPSSAIRALAEDPAVTVTGGVDSVEPCYERADIVIAPIRFGGGTRIKILEALAYCRPVVSTSIGAEGLDLVPERDILIADTPVEFANACLRLMEDEALRNRIAQSGRKRFEELYEAQTVQAKMIRDLQTIITGSSGDGQHPVYER